MTSVTIDVIGIVLQVGQVGTLKLKTGETRDKRSLVIGDDTNLSIQVTLWGETATKLDLKPGMMIACKQCKISEFSGKSLNGSSNLSDYVIGNINHARATAIQKWHSGFTDPQELVDQIGSLTEIRDIPTKPRNEIYHSILEMQETCN